MTRPEHDFTLVRVVCEKCGWRGRNRLGPCPRCGHWHARYQ